MRLQKSVTVAEVVFLIILFFTPLLFRYRCCMQSGARSELKVYVSTVQVYAKVVIRFPVLGKFYYISYKSGKS